MPNPGQSASVTILHLASNVPPVDIFVGVDTAPAVRNARYNGSRQTIIAPVGRVSLDVVASGQRLRTIDLNLQDGERYTAVILNERNVVLEDGDADVTEDATFLRLVHAASTVGRIDVWDLDENRRIIEGLEFGNASGTTRVALRSRRFGIDVDGDAVPDLNYDLGEIPSRTLVDVYAVEEQDTVVLRTFELDGESRAAMPEAQTVEPARIRVLHLSPDAPNVDVYANANRVVENIEFTRGTGFLEVEPNTYDFDITATGATDAVLSLTLPLASGEAVTAVAFDSVANIQALALPESSSPITSGARIRVVHAAVGVGEVDILDNVTGTILFEDVPFGAASPQVSAPAGVHSLGLDLDNDARAELVFDLPELPDGASANVFAVTDEAGAFLLVQLFDGTTLRINARHIAPPATAEARAIHLSPDAPNVNVYVDANPTAAITDLAFSNGTGYLELDAGARQFDVSATTLEERFLGPLALTLGEDESYTVAVFDRAATVQPLVLQDDRTTPGAGAIRIRAIHTAVGVPTVNIIAGGAALYEDLAFGTAGDALEVPAGAYVLGIDVNDDHHPDLSFSLPELTAGTIANVFAVADQHGNVRLLAQLDDGTVVSVDAH